jgi:pre-mRNA-processing factor 8
MSAEGNNRDSIESKAKKWTRLNSKRFAPKRAFGYADSAAKGETPPEVVRKLIRDHGDMSSRAFRHDKVKKMKKRKYFPFVCLCFFFFVVVVLCTFIIIHLFFS